MSVKKIEDINALSFEQALKKLEEIVCKLESGNAGLDEAMEIYEQGQILKDFCNFRLAGAKLQVEKINSENGGNISVSAFNPD